MSKALKTFSTLVQLAVVVLSSSQAVQAAALSAAKQESIPGVLSPSLTALYTQSAADKNSDHYQAIVAGKIGLSLGLVNKASIKLSTGFSRELDVLEERNVWSATSLSYISPAYELPQSYELKYTATAIAPTNSDQREFLGFRGNLGLEAAISKEYFMGTWVESFEVGVNSGIDRNFYEFDASLGGDPNNIASVNSGLTFGIKVHDYLQFDSEFGLARVLKSNNSWTEISYKHSVGLSSKVSKNLSLSLSEANENRALNYDAETTQIALYDYRTTVYKLSTTYSF